MKTRKILFFHVLLNLLIASLTHAQVSVPSNAIGTFDYLGSSNLMDVVFKGNGNKTAIYLYSNGYWGIGSGSFSPNFKLDVDAGDINISSFTNAYRIGDGSTGSSYKVLWHNGQIAGVF